MGNLNKATAISTGTNAITNSNDSKLSKIRNWFNNSDKSVKQGITNVLDKALNVGASIA